MSDGGAPGAQSSASGAQSTASGAQLSRKKEVDSSDDAAPNGDSSNEDERAHAEVGSAVPAGDDSGDIELHLSATATSGYRGVKQVTSGRFAAKYYDQHLGTYNTAVEAATAFARHMRSLDAQRQGQGRRADLMVRQTKPRREGEVAAPATLEQLAPTSGDEELGPAGKDEDGNDMCASEGSNLCHLLWAV
eukprot:3688927-Prymnesium_polylepis.1